MVLRKVEQLKAGVLYTFNADKERYAPSELILLTFTIANVGATDAVFEYLTSQFHDFVIKAEDGTEVARWSLGRTFQAVDRPVTLGAGKSMSFTTRWKQLDQVDRPVRPGRYEITAVHTTKTAQTSLSLFFVKER